MPSWDLQPMERVEFLSERIELICVVKIPSFLPPYEGKCVLELGSGDTHLSAELAKKAGQSDSINGHQNVKYVSAELKSPSLDISPESMDVIFTNSLLMQLSEEEVQNMVGNMLQWLKPEGFICLRESSVKQSEEHKGQNDSINCHEPRFYTQVFKECRKQAASGKFYELSLVGGKSNGNKICWIWQKVGSEDDKGFQQFLDSVQYKAQGILRYERVFGPGYVSTGGIETTREFVSRLDLKPGQKVLDVGCGIGGGDFYMAENFGVEVIGIDLSINMLTIALERAVGVKCAVEFEVADCTTKTYPDNSFDVIYSRDTILHIQDKPALFRSFYKWLKPGGKVLISDYCRNAGTPSPEFAEYIKQRGYDLHDVPAYGQMLRDAGFGEVIADDRTDQFIEVLQKELNEVEKDKDTFVNDFSEEDYNAIVGGWKSKLVRTRSGEQRWGLFIAIKSVKN
ncbi:hypothetical protein KSS87_018616 [Heliosperma pusillum]|nr:hypothetical protein KSS87_018616 [Heliosperma pusillum]